MKEIQLFGRMPERDVARLEGTLLDDDAYDQVIGGEDTIVYDSDGLPLVFYLHQAIPPSLIVQVQDDFRAMSLSGDLTNRGTAVMKGSSQPRVRVDGSIADTNEVNPKLLRSLPQTKDASNGVVGFLDANARFPYCRQTVYTMEHWARFQWTARYLQRAHDLFLEHYPSRHAPQHAMADRTEPSWVVPKTCFTTITINRNWQTAVHKDMGDYKPGCGVMGVIGNDNYDGGLFVYPKYRVAFDIRSGDLVINNVHEWHANTPLRGRPGYERISIVMYYREHMLRCAAPTIEEKKRAAFVEGDPEARVYANRPIITNLGTLTPKEAPVMGVSERQVYPSGGEQIGLGL